jgi:hypothetical protein
MRRTRPNLSVVSGLSKSADPPPWIRVYDGRAYCGHVRQTDCETGWFAFDHQGRQVGDRHRTIEAAVFAIPPRQRRWP